MSHSSDATLEIDATRSTHGALSRGKTFASAGGMAITIQDLTYSVKSNTKKGETAALLKSVTGFFEPRNMSALMGPSGSGKTTLLDLLAGRKTVGKTEGSILFAGHKPSAPFLRRYTGYVEQFDTLIPSLTVYEMLLYTAELKRPVEEPLESKKSAVEVLLDKLALAPCRDVPIGNALSKGISGGQAKRTNIGIALITNPRVLFLDEPTSGLDSYTSNEVMTVVRSLTSDDVTIIATIHSPTAYAFSLFDRLMMLVRGEVVYFGDNGAAALDYVRSSCPLLKEKSTGYNDAEWLVDLFTEADRMGRGGEFAKAYAASSLAKEATARVEEINSTTKELPESVQRELATKKATVTPSWWALWVLTKYRTSRNYRDPAFLAPRVGDKVLIGLLIMTLYLGIGDDLSSGNLINIAAVLFMWCTMPAFGAAAYVPTLVMDRALYIRERNDGLYTVAVYLASKLFDEMLIALPASCAVAAFVFYGIQLQGSFALFWLVYYTTLCVGIVLAYLIAAASPNHEVANALLPLYVVTLLFFGGFLFRYDDIPPWWYWYSTIDFLRYSWTALMNNQFGPYDPVFMPPNTTILQYYGMDGQSPWANFGYVWCFWAVFTVLAWMALRFIKHQKR